MTHIFLIGLFGMFGTLCRYGVDRLLLNNGHAVFSTTFFINVTGSLLAGVVYVLGERAIISVPAQSALLIGFCGGFTTFSAYAVQTVFLLEKSRALALLYFSLSPVASLLAAAFSVFLMRRLIA